MTISSGGYNFYPSTPQSSETTGEHYLKNTGETEGSVVILPQSQSTDILFTKLDNRTKWDYQAEQPGLAPHTPIQGNVPEKEGTAALHYDELLRNLPEDTLAELAGLPTVYTAALKFVLEWAAGALEAQDKALSKSSSKKDTTQFADKTYETAIQLGKELKDLTEKWAKKLGQNDPEYTENVEFMKDIKGLLYVDPKNTSSP